MNNEITTNKCTKPNLCERTRESSKFMSMTLYVQITKNISFLDSRVKQIMNIESSLSYLAIQKAFSYQRCVLYIILSNNSIK